MTLRSVLLSAVLLQAGMALATPSSASAGASLSKLQISVIDLAPGDGTTASYAWLPGTPWTAYSARIEETSKGRLDNGWMLEGSTSFATTKGTSTASLINGILSVDTRIASADHKGEASAVVSTGTAPYGENRYLLRLSPYTRITVTADASAWVTQAWGIAGRPERSFSRASLLIHESLADGSGEVFDEVFPYVRENGEMFSESRQLSISFFNDSASYQDIELKAVVDATVYLPIGLPVPEPSTWLLMGLGICGLAWRGRSTTQSKAAA